MKEIRLSQCSKLKFKFLLNEVFMSQSDTSQIKLLIRLK